MKKTQKRPLRIILRTEDDNALAFAKALSEGNFLLGILPSFGKHVLFMFPKESVNSSKSGVYAPAKVIEMSLLLSSFLQINLQEDNCYDLARKIATINMAIASNCHISATTCKAGCSVSIFSDAKMLTTLKELLVWQ